MQSNRSIPRRGSGIKLVFEAIPALRTLIERGGDDNTRKDDLLDLQRWMRRRRRGCALGVGPGYSSASKRRTVSNFPSRKSASALVLVN
jgi:hypothetical protein